MSITDFRRSSPAVLIGTAFNTYALGGVTVSSNGIATDGWVLVATGSNSAIWRNALAFGSNANDVGSVSTMGSSSSNTRADHVHRGLSSITHSSNTFYGPITLTTPGNTVGITSPASGTLAFTSTGGIGAGATNVGQELDYAERTSDLNVTAVTEAGADTVVTGAAVTYDGAVTVMIECFAEAIQVPTIAGGNNYIALCLYDGSSSIGFMAINLQPNSVTVRVPAYAARRLTPTAGSHTYSIRAFIGAAGTGVIRAGTGGSGAAVPAFIRITRVA